MGFGENMPLDVLFVRDDDIPDLVQEDVCDLGTGRPERARGEAPGAGRTRLSRRPFQTLRTLDFGRCRLALAVPERARSYGGPASLQRQRIATTYPYLLARFLAQHGIIRPRS